MAGNKMKAHSGAKKRFRANGTGSVIKRGRQNKNHILNKKSRERKRVARHGDVVDATQKRTIKRLIQA
jgi:large subunit ribosomal protein L35